MRASQPWLCATTDGTEIDPNAIMRRAEHEISYGAKRAIEMYIRVWEKGPAPHLFDKCARAHHLCQGEIEKCRVLMDEIGMVG